MRSNPNHPESIPQPATRTFSRSLAFSILAPVLAALVLTLPACKGNATDAKAAQTASASSDKDSKSADGKKEDTAVPVEVAKVARRPIAASYSGTASLDAPDEAQVVTKASGIVLDLLTEEGQRVHKGQVLARLDSEHQRLEVEQAESAVRKLEANYDRSQKMVAAKLVSTEANDQIKYDLDSARAALDIAQLELSYTNITAPISGVVAQRMVKVGNLVALDATLFRIVDDSHLEGVLNVPERELATMKAGLPVTMQVDAVAGKQFAGTIDRISPVVDASSGTFRVVCAFSGESGLKAGMFGRIGIVYDSRSNALTIPRVALLEDEGEPAVYAVRDGKAKRVSLKLGYIDGELAEVVSGLNEGDAVVTAGKTAIRDGAKVEV
ncbi:MAG TPA: efflux RND transporter periplasmic adaptor subunit, partial [Xanthomonadaceae bacterium]|nr:efflux RND transporter periplasmic adaptor subunit [Xanthomonadaceae bacterium]